MRCNLEGTSYLCCLVNGTRASAFVAKLIEIHWYRNEIQWENGVDAVYMLSRASRSFLKVHIILDIIDR